MSSLDRMRYIHRRRGRDSWRLQMSYKPLSLVIDEEYNDATYGGADKSLQASQLRRDEVEAIINGHKLQVEADRWYANMMHETRTERAVQAAKDDVQRVLQRYGVNP